MKKIVAIILALLMAVSIFLITFILNVESVTTYKNIKKITYETDYLELVDINTEENEMSTSFDYIYKIIHGNNFISKEIEKIYNSDYFKENMTDIMYHETQYLLTKKEYEITEKDLEKRVKKEKEKGKREVYEKLNDSFILIDHLIKNKIDKVNPQIMSAIRFLFKPICKVLLLCIMIGIIILEYILTKEKTLKYLAVPTMICGLLEIIIALLDTKIVNYIFKNKWVANLLLPYSDVLAEKLMITGIIILIVSLVYLVVNEKVETQIKVILKPKRKKKSV